MKQLVELLRRNKGKRGNSLTETTVKASSDLRPVTAAKILKQKTAQCEKLGQYYGNR